MKTAEEFCAVNQWWHTAAAAVRGRDAEWRHLVEEAQAERDRLQVEVIRLTRDSVEVNAYRRDEIAAGNKACAERDRLKGELVELDALSLRLAKELSEARQLIKTYVACDDIPASSAEQARAVSWKVELDEPDNGLLSQVNARLNALTTHMEELDLRVGRLEPPPPDYAHHHEFRQWEREGWPDRCGVRVRDGDAPQCLQPAAWEGHEKAAPEDAGPGFSTPTPIEPSVPALSREDARDARDRINPRPREPEAAGPGHSFEDGPDGQCGYSRDGILFCGRDAGHAIHAESRK